MFVVYVHVGESSDKLWDQTWTQHDRNEETLPGIEIHFHDDPGFIAAPPTLDKLRRHDDHRPSACLDEFCDVLENRNAEIKVSVGRAASLSVFRRLQSQHDFQNPLAIFGRMTEEYVVKFVRRQAGDGGMLIRWR